MSRKPHFVTPPSPSQSISNGEGTTPPKATPQADAKASAEAEATAFDVSIDEDTGIATFALVDGTLLSLAEPKAGHFLRVDAWRATAPDDLNSDIVAGLKLAHSCIVRYCPDGEKSVIKPDFEPFIDSLDFDDVERVGSVLSNFRSFARLAERVKAASSLPGAGIQSEGNL